MENMELPAGFLRIPLSVPVLPQDFRVVDPEGANDPEQKIWYYHQAEGLKTIVHIWLVEFFLSNFCQGVFFSSETIPPIQVANY